MAYKDELVLKMFIQPEVNDKLRAFYVNAVKIHNAGITSPFANAGFDIEVFQRHFLLPDDRETDGIVVKNARLLDFEGGIRVWGLGIHFAMYAYRPYTPSPTRNGHAFWSGFSYHTRPDGSLDKDITIVEIPQAYYLYTHDESRDFDPITRTYIENSLPIYVRKHQYRNKNVHIIDAAYREEIVSSFTSADHYIKICHPSLSPFKIVIVETIEELGNPITHDDIPSDNHSPGTITPHKSRRASDSRAGGSIRPNTKKRHIRRTIVK